MSHGTPDLVEHLRRLTSGGRLLCEVLDQLGDKRIVRLTDLTKTKPLDVGAALRAVMVSGRPVQPCLKEAAKKPAAATVKQPGVRSGGGVFREGLPRRTGRLIT